MATGKALDGKPYAGNPHVRFDEGEVAPAATPRRGSLLYNITRMMAVATVVAASATFPMAARAATPITNTIDGVEWRFMLDTPDGTSGTAMLGINTSTSSTTGRGVDALRACPAATSVNAANIPWEFDYDGIHYSVTRVCQGAFYQCYNLTGIVTLPPAVTVLRNYAFQTCTGLTGLRGGDSVTSWGTYAFNGCNSMAGVYPDFSAATTFGACVFGNCPLTGTLKLGSSATSIPSTFINCFFSGAAIIPANVNTIGADDNVGSFANNPNLTAIWVKGKATAASQTYSTVYCAKFAASCTSLKMILMGQNTKGGRMTKTGSDAMLYGCTGVQVFVPANGYWNGIVAGGTNNKVWYYGPTKEFNLVVDDNFKSATFTTTTVDSFTNALAWASMFKEHLDLNPRISVTNTLDLTGVTITEQMVSGVTFDRLMFAAKTQVQLNAILGAFPATTPISIDPTGLTENMVIPNGYPNVHVKSVPGMTIKRTASGFMIIVM